MEDFQQRVIDEKLVTERNLTNLDKFIFESKVYESLSDSEKIRLTRQSHIMNMLVEVLEERIAAF